MRVSAMAFALLVAACTPRREPSQDLGGAAPLGSIERTTALQVAPGVIATVVAPERVDPSKRTDLVLYALPNGNSTEQTMGRRMTPGLDWHFDIQHIAAQTRALRTMGMPQAIVVYLEADSKSWPAWRRTRGYDSANREIVRIVDRIRSEVVPGNRRPVSVTLTGHSGGGSFMFGFIEGQQEIPDWLERIAFLDANYNFDAATHGEKFRRWLARDARHTLAVVAYDDREIMLDGKKVVDDSGGTFRATERMMRFLRGKYAFASDTIGGFRRERTEQMEILVHPNPGNRILHTELIGEMNAYMHAMLVRRAGYARSGEVLRPARAYERWITPE